MRAIALAIIAALTLAPAASANQEETPAPRLSSLAASIAEKPIDVECFTSPAPPRHTRALAGWSEFGAAVPFGRLVVLAPAVCLGVGWAIQDPRFRRREALGGFWRRVLEGDSLFVLLHEIGHTVNGPAEGAADCYALEHEYALAIRLGMTPRTAQQMLAEGRLFHEQSGPGYSGSCT